MHTIQEIRAEYDRLDRLLHVNTSGIEIVISSRSVKRLGSFRSPGGNVPPSSATPLRISISAVVMEDDALFWDTIRHEYAHAVVYLTHPGERHGHDEVWKAVCRRIGCTPKSTTAASDGQKEEWAASAKYRVHCERCGADSYYHRAGKIVQTLLYGDRTRVRCRCGSHELSLYVRP
ncbi:MAG: SprT-like domain-containing protein [Oscillospiraceae bacterium]